MIRLLPFAAILLALGCQTKQPPAGGGGPSAAEIDALVKKRVAEALAKLDTISAQTVRLVDKSGRERAVFTTTDDGAILTLTGDQSKATITAIGSTAAAVVKGQHIAGVSALTDKFAARLRSEADNARLIAESLDNEERSISVLAVPDHQGRVMSFDADGKPIYWPSP